MTRPDGTSIDPVYESASGRLDTITLKRGLVVEGVFDYGYETIVTQDKGRRQTGERTTIETFDPWWRAPW